MAKAQEESAIIVDGASKTFRLPHERVSSVKSLLLTFYRRRRTFEQQHALTDVSFEIKKGEFFGIVGRNGSGKSTLLKLLAGIYSPTKGSIGVNGKLTPFIELGVGFNPELTGRENVFLNGALLGFNRKEVREMYDDIVSFAELDRFMDQKLKNYSSGMQVRLAFSIAIRVKSDILVLDEVLAVGDEAFQQKCIDVFENYKAEKQTVVLVTHDMSVVRRFCSRAMLINKGKVVAIGTPTVVAGKYSQMNEEEADESVEPAKSTSKITVRVVGGKNKHVPKFASGQDITVNVTWPDDYESVRNVGVAIVKNTGEYIFGANTFDKPPQLTGSKISYKVNLAIGPGKYHLMVGVFGASERSVIDFLEHSAEFIVYEEKSTFFGGVARLEHSWSDKAS
jgi:ABC-2 type transport system ATP-binding protein